MRRRTSIIRLIPANDIHLAHQDRKSYRHRNGDDRQIDPREVKSSDVDMLPGKDISP